MANALVISSRQLLRSQAMFRVRRFAGTVARRLSRPLSGELKWPSASTGHAYLHRRCQLTTALYSANNKHLSGNGQTSSPEFSAFSKVKPDLVKQLNFNFLQLKEQCQAAGLMTFAEVQANFGGRSPSPTEDMSLLLEIVLSRIRLDPSLYSKFMGLPLLQDPVHGEVVSQMGNILEDERAEEHRSPATLGSVSGDDLSSHLASQDGPPGTTKDSDSSPSVQVAESMDEMNADLGALTSTVRNEQVYQTPIEEQEWCDLFKAAGHGNLQTAAKLIKAGVNMNRKNEDGFTPLHLACKNGHRAVVSLLLEAGADLQAVSKEGFTALHWACKKGHRDIVSLLWTCGTDPQALTKLGNSATPLMLACVNGHVDVVDELLATKSVSLDQLSGDGWWTALMLASHCGYLQVVEKLIKAGATVEQRCKEGFTALHYACREGHRYTVSLLLACGADTQALTKLSVTPLMLACLYGHGDIVDELLATKSIKLDQLTGDGTCTALMMASEYRHLQIVKKLIKAGATVDRQNKEGFTALHWACMKGHRDIVSLLLTCGADAQALTKLGPCVTPLMLACMDGHGDVVDELLATKSVSLDQLSGDGSWTALMVATDEGHLQIVKKLIKAGVTVDQQNKDGKTALEIALDGKTVLEFALDQGYRDIVQVLLEHY